MNAAHYHLLINHFPIVGLFLGILVLTTAIIFRKGDIKLTSFGIFILSAIAAATAFFTGEGAEEFLENFAGTSETLIHAHEEYAEVFFGLSLFLGTLAVLAFVFELKKSKYSKYFSILVMLLALITAIFAIYVGNSGGEIRHSEIRNDAKMILIESSDN